LDTKLRNFRYSVWLKTFAVIICVAGMLSTAYGLQRAPYFDSAVQNKDFSKSMYLRDIVAGTYSQLSYIAFTYKNEENIKSGNCLDMDLINDRRSQLLNDKQNELNRIREYYRSLLSNNADTGNEYPYNTDPFAQNSTEREKLLNERKNDVDKINEKYDALVNNVEEDYIKEQLDDYHLKLKYLNENSGVYYSLEEGGEVYLSNTGNSSSSHDFFKSLPVNFLFDQKNDGYVMDKYLYAANLPSDAVINVGLSQERYDSELARYNKEKQEGLVGLKVSSAGLLAFILGLIYLIYGAGRSSVKDGLQLLSIDNIYLDAALTVSAAVIVLCVAPVFEYGKYLIYSRPSYYNNTILTIILCLTISIGTLTGIAFVTMLTRRIKRREVISNTLIRKICLWLFRELRIISGKVYKKLISVYDSSPAVMRLILIFGVYILATIISILILFTAREAALLGLIGLAGINIAAIYFLLKAFKILKDIREGAERIRLGELTYNLPEVGIPELKQLSHTINRIADGLKSAVGSQVKAERMKAELITNVSHDLKTPLTSILTYVDLLKNEGLMSENSQKYLEIIDSKSQRLKTLTEDLFDAAKASSGSIAVDLEELNVVSLINQGLGELSDKIDASGLSFRTNFSSEKLPVRADGKLLWRVMENLLSNVFKYALPHSRVYIDANLQDEKIIISIKNISAYELNIPEEELMERFKRGDTSRSSEGSGLGLSIAKSLTELQGGSFSIKIDGDLFKANVVLPAAL
jgi:signal transduction histidine kinase